MANRTAISKELWNIGEHLSEVSQPNVEKIGKSLEDFTEPGSIEKIPNIEDQVEKFVRSLEDHIETEFSDQVENVDKSLEDWTETELAEKVEKVDKSLEDCTETGATQQLSNSNQVSNGEQMQKDENVQKDDQVQNDEKDANSFDSQSDLKLVPYGNSMKNDYQSDLKLVPHDHAMKNDSQSNSKQASSVSGHEILLKMAKNVEVIMSEQRKVQIYTAIESSEHTKSQPIKRRLATSSNAIPLAKVRRYSEATQQSHSEPAIDSSEHAQSQPVKRRVATSSNAIPLAKVRRYSEVPQQYEKWDSNLPINTQQPTKTSYLSKFVTADGKRWTPSIESSIIPQY